MTTNTKQTNEIEKIYSEYIYTVPDDKFIMEKVDREKLSHDLFETDIDETSVRYLVLLDLYYERNNPNRLRDFLEWHNSEVQSKQIQFLREFIAFVSNQANVVPQNIKDAGLWSKWHKTLVDIFELYSEQFINQKGNQCK